MTTNPGDVDRIYAKILNHNSLTLRQALAEESSLISGLEHAARRPDILLPNLCLEKISLEPGVIQVKYTANRPKEAVEKDYWGTLVEKEVIPLYLINFINKGMVSPTVGYEEIIFNNQGPFGISLRICGGPVPEPPKNMCEY